MQYKHTDLEDVLNATGESKPNLLDKAFLHSDHPACYASGTSQ